MVFAMPHRYLCPLLFAESRRGPVALLVRPQLAGGDDLRAGARYGIALRGHSLRSGTPVAGAAEPDGALGKIRNWSDRRTTCSRKELGASVWRSRHSRRNRPAAMGVVPPPPTVFLPAGCCETNALSAYRDARSCVACRQRLMLRTSANLSSEMRRTMHITDAEQVGPVKI